MSRTLGSASGHLVEDDDAPHVLEPMNVLTERMSWRHVNVLVHRGLTPLLLLASNPQAFGIYFCHVYSQSRASLIL